METNKIAKFLNLEWVMLFGFILAKLVLSLLPISYGIFRDEFYYINEQTSRTWVCGCPAITPAYFSRGPVFIR